VAAGIDTIRRLMEDLVPEHLPQGRVSSPAAPSLLVCSTEPSPCDVPSGITICVASVCAFVCGWRAGPYPQAVKSSET
jgi:hypothetical protein